MPASPSCWIIGSSTIFAAYASAKGSALVDRELYLPKSSTSDADRCRAAKVPGSRVLATNGELARAMILRALASPLPIAWVTGDCAYGQEWRMRTLEEAGLGYVLAAPKSQQLSAPFGRIDQAIADAPEKAWERHSCGDGAKARAFTAGLPHACRRSVSSTATGPPTSGGYWAAAAWSARTRSPAASPTPPTAPALPPGPYCGLALGDLGGLPGRQPAPEQSSTR
ncbi:transposase [Streptomyces olivaceoviridis]|uniref:Transposase IS701-like DDE domain-containing protein n=1 Tax=Streptomyces canarius TaxID=285453 RepID=A0ABQ3DDZ6_9ACTN|nr:transposase [Streptomyces canarius]GHA65816.1 hypothetical protein GCM10010345_82130 [Streptomyces canarius]